LATIWGGAFSAHEELEMKRYVVMSLAALLFLASPGQAQLLQKLEQGLMGGQQQQGMRPGFIGNVNLPPGQYMLTNTQTGQALCVAVQNGQMFMQQSSPQMMAPGQGMMQQQPGMFGGGGGGGIGNFLKNGFNPQQQQQQQMQQQFPGQ
jgi:hypothetical protein